MEKNKAAVWFTKKKPQNTYFSNFSSLCVAWRTPSQQTAPASWSTPDLHISRLGLLSSHLFALTTTAVGITSAAPSLPPPTDATLPWGFTLVKFKTGPQAIRGKRGKAKSYTLFQKKKFAFWFNWSHDHIPWCVLVCIFKRVRIDQSSLVQPSLSLALGVCCLYQLQPGLKHNWGFETNFCRRLVIWSVGSNAQAKAE